MKFDQVIYSTKKQVGFCVSIFYKRVYFNKFFYRKQTYNPIQRAGIEFKHI